VSAAEASPVTEGVTIVTVVIERAVCRKKLRSSDFQSEALGTSTVAGRAARVGLPFAAGTAVAIWRILLVAPRMLSRLGGGRCSVIGWCGRWWWG
jgi:hypothetical protein